MTNILYLKVILAALNCPAQIKVHSFSGEINNLEAPTFSFRNDLLKYIGISYMYCCTIVQLVQLLDMSNNKLDNINQVLCCLD